MQSRLMVSSPICLAGLFFQPLLVVHNWMSLYSQLEVEFLPFLMISSFCSALRWAGSVYLLILDWERERAEREREKKIFSIFYVWMYDAKWWWRCKPTQVYSPHDRDRSNAQHLGNVGLFILFYGHSNWSADPVRFNLIPPDSCHVSICSCMTIRLPDFFIFLDSFFFLCWSFFVVITEPVDKLLVEPDWLSSWQW